MKSDTLHLVLKHRWYDMIASGEKTEEYRENTGYWQKRLLGSTSWAFFGGRQGQRYKLPLRGKTKVCFHKGYTSTTMTFNISAIEFGHGYPQWGAPTEKCLIIKLGKRL